MSSKSLNILNLFHIQIYSIPCCYLVSILVMNLISIPILTIFFPTRDSLPPYILNPEKCPYGRVYAYDLPPMLQYNCTWNSQCGIFSNHGLGEPATELRRILPGNISGSWHRTNQFALELIFHLRILQHKCRTLDPESATAFYIPFYAGLAVRKHVWSKINDTTKRDLPCAMLLQWLQQQSYWKRSNGSDHFMAIGRTTWEFRRRIDGSYPWGSALLNTDAMRRVTRLIIEKFPTDDRDVGAPYPTGFHPGTKATLENWQNFVREYNRSSLFAFVGGPMPSISNDFRGFMMSYCSNESSSCRAVDCAAAHCTADSSVVLESFLGSEFCLQPRGDSFTRRSVFDCMIAGSVPVVFWNETIYSQYKWFLPEEPESYSVFILHKSLRRRGSIIKQVLMSYSKKEIRKMREKVIETIPRIIYGIQNGGLKDFEDAFDIALHGVMERIKRENRFKIEPV